MRKKKDNFKWIGIGIIVGIALGLFIGAQRNIRQWLQTFGYVLNLVHRNYVQELDPNELIQHSIQGMLQKLDQHSVYLDTIGYEELKIHTSGEYGGLGFRVSKVKESLTIMEVFEGYPAYQAGLQAGDKIIKINGISTKGMQLHEAVTKMRGDVGTHVTLTVKKEGIKEPIDFHLTREMIKIKNVMHFGLIDSDIGYVRIAQFSANTGEEVREALDSLTSQGAKKFIVDLRTNPGGLLQEAVKVVDNFLPKGRIVVSTKGKAPASNRDFYTTTDSKIGTAPIIVLVNRQSASASEIVAGAIQDWDAGLILGDTTFGKGSVQTIFPLEEGAIKLTTATYHTPSGRCINRSDTVQYLLKNPTLGMKFTTVGPLRRNIDSEGSIIPDIVLEPAVSLSPLLLHEAKFPPLFIYTANAIGVVMQYASKYVREHPEIKRDFNVGNSMLQDFKSFLRAKEIEFTDAQFDSASQLIAETLKERIAETKWGIRAKYEVIFATDPWIKSAIDIITKANEAEKLFEVAHIK